MGYAKILCLVVLCCGLVTVQFIHLLEGSRTWPVTGFFLMTLEQSYKICRYTVIFTGNGPLGHLSVRVYRLRCYEPLQWREMSASASQFTCLPIVCSAVYSVWHQKKTSEVRISGPLCGKSAGDRWFSYIKYPLVTGGFPHKWSVIRKVFPCNGVIITLPST